MTCIINFYKNVYYFYYTLEKNGHLSAPKIGVKVAYISNKSELWVKSKICGTKVKFSYLYNMSRSAVPTLVIVSWRSASRKWTRDGASMQNRSCIDNMTNEPGRESPASTFLSTACIEILEKVRLRFFPFVRSFRQELSFVWEWFRSARLPETSPY